MKPLGSWFLRGPNLHATTPCHVVLLDMSSFDEMEGDALARFRDRLGAVLPDGPVPASGRADDIAKLLARMTVRLQALAGSPVDFERAVPAGSSAPGQYRLVCGYRFESVVEAAAAMAVDIVLALMRGQAYDAAPALDALRARVAASSVDAGTQALVDAARARGIPVMRLESDGPDFQFGWGARQRRHRAAPAGARTEVPTIESLFPGDADGRIPVVAVTGTNGKTTTTQLIAHAMRESGARTGTTTTQGVYLDGRCIEAGDCTGYWSARTVLMNEAVEVAALETARGGILKRGLAFDRCDVGVVLNVSSDHLGLDGVETLDDLARVKGLIARCASTAAVLNADDDHCVAMQATLRPGCRTVFFGLDPGQPVLMRHLAAGGQGACLDDGWLVWCEAAVRERVADAATLPLTLGGHARYNIANALAALAALRCIGHGSAAIAAAFAGFVSDARRNPLRANQFEVGGVKLIVDYAHNVVAYRALCDMARSLLQGRGRLLGVVTSPGDRRAEDLFETGRVCGERFDELVVYEHDPRGRGAGDTTRAILAGARSAAPSGRLHGEPRIRLALARGLDAARPGDVLVFTCAGTFDDVVEGVRLHHPAAADAIAREVSA